MGRRSRVHSRTHATAWSRATTTAHDRCSSPTMMKVKSRTEVLSRDVRSAALGVACLALLAGNSARAQSTPPRPTIRAWAGVGAGFSPAGLVGAWEAWGGLGVLGV